MKQIAVRIALFVIFASFASAADLDTAPIDQQTRFQRQKNPRGGVYKVTLPRSDVKVVVGDWTMPPFMGLGTWAAFTGTNDKALMMGDTVLFEDEVNPVMSVAFDNGLSVTALHNHFFFDQPKVYFMHLEGQDTVEKLATAVRKVYDKIKEIRAADPQPKTTIGQKSFAEKSSITGAPLNEIFNMQGDVKDGIVKYSIGHKAK